MRRAFLPLFAFGGLALVTLTACPGAHKQPTGPAPEYEEPPPPSWLKNGQPSTPAPAAIPVDPVPTQPAPGPVADGGVS